MDTNANQPPAQAATDQSPKEKSWHEHPIYAAAAAAAATVLLCIAVYKEVLLPAQLAGLQFRSEDLERKVSRAEAKAASATNDLESASKSAKDQSERDSAQIQAQENEIKELRSEISELKTAFLFREASVYPVGLEKVRIGDSIDAANSFYPAPSIQKDEDDYWSVTVSHPYLERVTYYFRESDRKIYQVLFQGKFRHNLGETYLDSQLRRRFGEPTKVSNTHVIWARRDGEIIFKDNTDTFIIAGKGVIPGGWDRPIKKFLEQNEAACRPLPPNSEGIKK